MDIDTVSKKNSHEEILNRFKNENIDILIGTQMVVKGHHFPNVTLVGVIAADSSLHLEDYRSNERTFQILTQVAGRAGRENQKGKVIVQTYNPENFAIECSKEQNFNMFYETEIELRKQLKYPPFCDIIMIGFTGKDLNEIQKLSNLVYKKLKSVINDEIFVYKPVPAPIDKIKNKYRWRIIIKCKVTSNVLNMVNYAIEDERIKKCKETSIIVDINPNTMN
jgi:primosomal protein N' (replication factor Y)